MKFLFSKSGRDKLKNGIDTTANAIKVTLGAKGRNVVIKTSNGRPYITKDGVTVARSIFLDDEVEDMGAMLVKEASIKTVEQAGDGTTTVSVLLQALVDNCNIQLSDEDVNVLDVKKGIEIGIEQVIDFVKKSSTVITDLDIVKSIATISANNDEVIGGLIHEAYMKVGRNGYVTIEESNSHETTLSVNDGYSIDRGYIRHDFITNIPKMKCELNDVKVLIVEKAIQNPLEIQGILNEIAKKNKSLLLIADEVQSGALELISMNKQRGALRACVVKSPSFGDEKNILLRDIALSTGATVISDANGISLDKVQMKHLGTATKVISDKNSTFIVDGSKDTTRYIEVTKELEDLIESNKDVKETREVEFAKIRLAKLQNNVAVIKVGGFTETEMKERKDRIEDAVSATKSAMEEGYVAGGGSTLVRASEALTYTGNKQVDVGIDIVRKSIKEPFLQILRNSGVNDADSVIKEVLENDNFGYNAKYDKVENLIESGVIDPVKVIRVALENSSSIAIMFLISECVIY